MVHSEHNRSRNSGWYALIIFGAIMLFLAPAVYPDDPGTGITMFVAGVVVGGLGFFLRFVRRKDV